MDPRHRLEWAVRWRWTIVQSCLEQGVPVPIEVHHPAFQFQRLSVEPASGFIGPKILLNGVAVKRRKGRYPVLSDSGAEMLVKMKFNLVDPIPTLMIDDQPVKLAEPLQW